jgi:anti-sigma factor RsiW
MTDHDHISKGAVCAQLDDYLNGDLDELEAVRFTRHLSACSACSDEVDQQRWINELLQSDTASQREAAPAFFLRPSRLSRWQAGLTVAAIVCGVVAAPWTINLLKLAGTTPDAPRVVENRPSALDLRESPPSSPVSDAHAAVHFASSGPAIALPVESTSPEVTIVQLYPTVGVRHVSVVAHKIAPLGGAGEEL